MAPTASPTRRTYPAIPFALLCAAIFAAALTLAATMTRPCTMAEGAVEVTDADGTVTEQVSYTPQC